MLLSVAIVMTYATEYSNTVMRVSLDSDLSNS